jgi:hypothetical protein
MSVNRGRAWTAINEGLSNLRIAALAIHPAGMTLYAGTFAGGVVALELRQPATADRVTRGSPAYLGPRP